MLSEVSLFFQTSSRKLFLDAFVNADPVFTLGREDLYSILINEMFHYGIFYFHFVVLFTILAILTALLSWD